MTESLKLNYSNDDMIDAIGYAIANQVINKNTWDKLQASLNNADADYLYEMLKLIIPESADMFYDILETTEYYIRDMANI